MLAAEHRFWQRTAMSPRRSGQRRSETAMRFARNPGKWLWRRLRLGSWFARWKAEGRTETAAEAGGDRTERSTDRGDRREKAASSQQRGKGRGGSRRHRKKRH